MHIYKNFRHRLLLTLVIMSGLSVTAVAADKLNSPAPDFALRSLDGTNLRLSEYRSDVVVLNFWASWCRKCSAASKYLHNLHEQNAASGLQVMAVAIDGDDQHARRYAERLGLDHPILLNDKQSNLSKAYELGRLPVTVIIDRAGMWRFVHTGFDSDNERLIAAEISALLAE